MRDLPVPLPIVATCEKCGRGFVMVNPDCDMVDHFAPPLIKHGRKLVPKFDGAECGGKIVRIEGQP
jgi:hypothetical protein